jgi:outer membrane protein assembly factor BamB
MKKHFFQIFILSILAASCRKELVENTTSSKPVAENHPELIWSVLIDSNKSVPLSMDPIVFKNDVIASSADYLPKNVIIKYSGEDGRQLASWNNWLRNPSTLIGSSHTAIQNNLLVIEAGTECVSINPNTFNTNWHHVKDNQSLISKSLFLDNDKIYSTARFDFSLPVNQNKKCSLIRYSNNQLEIDTIFTLTANDDFSPWIEGVEFATLPNGDEVVFGKNRESRHFSVDPFYNRMAVFAYNISKQKMIWYNDSVEMGFSGGMVKSLYYNGTAIIFGQKKIHCFDLSSGVKKWSFHLGNDAFWGTPIVHKNKLLYKDVWNSLFAIDPNTGIQLWRLDNLGGCGEQAVLYNDKIFYCSGDLWVVSADNGTIIYNSKEASWNMGLNFSGTPAIDSVNRRIYLTDDHHLFAIKILDSW